MQLYSEIGYAKVTILIGLYNIRFSKAIPPCKLKKAMIFKNILIFLEIL